MVISVAVLGLTRFRHKVSWRRADIEELGFNAGLSRLTKLRKLKVSFAALFGIRGSIQERFTDSLPQQQALRVSLPEMLPHCLQYLEIICCDYRVIPQLQELASACGTGKFDRLKTIKCIFPEEHTDRSKVTQVEIPEVNVEFIFCDLKSRYRLLYHPMSEYDKGTRKDHSEIFDDPMMLYGDELH